MTILEILLLVALYTVLTVAEKTDRRHRAARQTMLYLFSRKYPCLKQEVLLMVEVIGIVAIIYIVYLVKKHKEGEQ